MNNYEARKEIYESALNGQNEQAYEQAQTYGLDNFLRDIQSDYNGFYGHGELLVILRRIMLIASVRGNLK